MQNIFVYCQVIERRYYC